MSLACIASAYYCFFVFLYPCNYQFSLRFLCCHGLGEIIYKIQIDGVEWGVVRLPKESKLMELVLVIVCKN